MPTYEVEYQGGKYRVESPRELSRDEIISRIGSQATAPQPEKTAAPDPREAYYAGPQKERGFLGELGRQVGLTGRAIAGGAAQMLEPFTAPVAYGLNAVLPGNPVGSLESATDWALTAAGVPEPENETERDVQGLARFGTGFMGGFGLANKADDAVLAALNLPKSTPYVVPTAESLRRTAGEAYDAAESAGVAISPDSFGRFVNRLNGLLRHEGYDRELQTKIAPVLRRLTEQVESGKPLDVREFEILRKLTKPARASVDDSEARLGRRIVDELDDYLNNVGGPDLISGDAKAASEALKQARDAWTRTSKSDTVQDAIELAGIRAGQFSGSGFENALRTQFRQIAMNNKRMRLFSPEEQAAIKKIASGGPLDNAMRTLGKFAPTGIVSTGMSGAIGYGIAGPAGAAALPALGAGARRAATELTRRNVGDLERMVLAGQPVPRDAPDWLLPWIAGGAFGADMQGAE